MFLDAGRHVVCINRTKVIKSMTSTLEQSGEYNIEPSFV